jgi:RNA polymerase sigma-70 factor, ECF subfamily
MMGPSGLSDKRQTETDRLDTLSEEVLARRVQLGCIPSYEELDRRLRPRLVYLLMKRTGSREDAEDLAQQTLLRAYQKIDGYDPGRRFRAWLFTIAIRLSIDAYRRRGVNALGGEGIERVVDPGEGPAETVSRREGQRRLWSLADRVLDPTQRTALWLHYGEQLKGKEIARTLGITAVHVRVLLYRARRTMMKHLDEPVEAGVVGKPVKVEAHQCVAGAGCKASGLKEGAVT